MFQTVKRQMSLQHPSAAFDEAIEISQCIEYSLQLRLATLTQDTSLQAPPEIEQIVELAHALPKPDEAAWAALSLGKLPKAKTKLKGTNGNGSGSVRNRGKWTEENKEEMVRLVENDSLRAERLGEEGTRNGIVNWSALAARYGFSTSDPIRRMYHQLTGKIPPGSRGKNRSAQADEPPAKKVKSGADGKASAALGKQATSDGWNAELGKELVRLVDDENYRKQKTGKSKLKWSRVLRYLGKESKKECKRKYVQLTGKPYD